MCMIALPLLITGILTSYLSAKVSKHASRLEVLSGLALISGMATLGFCLPLYR
jgi:hypothetical protein